MSTLRCTNGTITYVNQNDSYYFYNIIQTNCQSLVCDPQKISFSITNLKNNLYPKYMPNTFILFINYNNSRVVNPIVFNIAQLIAAQAVISASRSITQTFAKSEIRIDFNLF